jgi:hypothetical protein
MSNKIMDSDKRKFFIDYTSTTIELIRRNVSDFIDKNRNILNVNVSEFNYEVINLAKNIQEQTTSYINKREEAYYRDNIGQLQEKLLTGFTISSNAVGIIISNSNFSTAYEKLCLHNNM